MHKSAPRQFADSYVETINRSAYSELGALFAEDAVFLGPDGRVFHGREEISTFYKQFLSEVTPDIRIASYVEQGDDCVYELEVKAEAVGSTEEYVLSAIDHATLDAHGKVKRFTVWRK